jgi:thiol-disulfide isomerase/thioredoxin
LAIVLPDAPGADSLSNHFFPSGREEVKNRGRPYGGSEALPVEVLGPKDFEGDRLTRPGTWAVGFLASWCPFCRAFRPKFERFSAGPEVHLAVADVSEEENPLWDSLRVEVVPTLVVFRDGRPTWRRDGRAGEGLDERDLRALAAAVA